MQLSRKIFLPIVIFLGALIAVSAFGFWSLYAQHSDLNGEIALSRALNQDIEKLESSEQRMEINVFSYRIAQDPETLKTIENAETEINNAIQEIQNTTENQAVQDLIQRVASTRLNIETVNNQLIAAIDTHQEPLIQRNFRVWITKIKSIDAAIVDLTTFNLNTVEHSATDLDSLVWKILLALLAMTGAAIVISLLLTLYFHRTITAPIEELAFAANKVARKQFDFKLNIDSEDEIGFLAHVFQDMSGQVEQYYKYLEEELHKKDEFISIASHELKTPLTSLKIYLQVLEGLAEKNKHKEYREYFQKINNQFEKMNNLVSDLLDIARLEGGKITYNKESFDLNSLVKAIADEMQTLSTNHTISIIGTLEVPAYGDPHRISQVLTNLLSNAIKYSPEKPEIVIHLSLDKNMAHVAVEDSGIGIHEKHHSRLFERFFRVDDNPLITFPGMGVGLYISSQIIIQHGGMMWLESIPGDGSTFHFTLPLSPN